MAHVGLPELLHPRYDEKHRGRMIFTGQQVPRLYVLFNCHDNFELTQYMYWIPLAVDSVESPKCSQN